MNPTLSKAEELISLVVSLVEKESCFNHIKENISARRPNFSASQLLNLLLKMDYAKELFDRVVAKIKK